MGSQLRAARGMGLLSLFRSFCSNSTYVPPSGLQVRFVPREKLSPTLAAEGEVAGLRATAGQPVSVDEPLAGLFPAAGGAPHVSVLHPIHLPALLALPPGLP